MKNEPVFDWNGFCCVGSKLPLEHPRLAILNSAQSKYPLGGDDWIQGTLRALQFYSGERYTLLTSMGLNTWEFTTWAGGARGYPLILVLIWDGRSEPSDLYRALASDLALEPGRTTLLLLPPAKGSIKDQGPRRDHLIVSLAKKVVPISIHPGGRMESLLASLTGEKIDFSFSRDWKHQAQIAPYFFDIAHLQTEIDPHWEGWVIHWTHACQGPWPGETRARYFQSVLESREEYTHSAQRTLERIIEEGRIRSSSWRIRGKERVVCLSGLLPSQAADLVRWRARYVRFSIEPYGLGIHSSAVKRLGIRPVHYLEEGIHSPQDIPAFLLQSSGRSGDWPRENEYRYQGDLDLNRLATEEWKPIILPTGTGRGRYFQS